MKSCEDLFNGRWNDLPPMHTARIFAGAVQFKAMDIYVFCGTTNGYQSGAVASIENFKASSSKWSIFFIKNSPEWNPRLGVAAINLFHNQEIMIYGGKEGANNKLPCFLFNPRTKVLNLASEIVRKQSKREKITEQIEEEEDTSRLLEELMKESAVYTALENIKKQSDSELHTSIQKPKVKSDSTHAEFQCSRRYNPMGIKPRISYTPSPAQLRAISRSPYLSHLNKESLEFKQISESAQGQRKTSRQSSLDQTLGRVVRSSSKDLTIRGRSRYEMQSNLPKLSPIKEKDLKSSRRGSLEYSLHQQSNKQGLFGIMGYCSPVVPIIQLGINLTTSRLLKGNGEEEIELCWYDQAEERWKVGAEWLAKELNVGYFQDSTQIESDITCLKLKESSVLQNAQLSGGFSSFNRGIQECPAGRSSLYPAQEQ